MACWGCNHASGRPVGAGKPIVIHLTSEGAPISDAAIDLSGVGGGTLSSSEGDATLEHVPFGSYRVVVHANVRMSEMIPTEETATQRSMKRPAKSSIPRKYHDEKTTPLEIEVTQDGPDRFEFDLSK
ncbi:carboxypeptidase-like regulatory domain-containing protein [Blastopirellula marina]|uniref:Carboxypeptidase regulatory-like domain-containing protein n=1 Tax=Blastopirellula marina DSM 3645 TaxID=314230 RepID=A3ZQX3_9BACT|nr:carboxypeptidase-like regulatory domain-containing protein [Blastopirellula marina]EAQ81066.1 hypothetical protein DSM3645_20882 [Blastopirellula marina DSM 3645]